MITKGKMGNVLMLFLASLLLINPLAVINAVKGALFVCYESVIPSLYPIMVFSNYLSSDYFIKFFSLPFLWYARLMKIEDNRYPGYLAISLFGGFAVAATFIARLKKAGYEQNAVNCISISMINNSFSFCVLAVGAIYIGNAVIGLQIYLALICSSLITAFILSFIKQYNIVMPTGHCIESNISFVEAIKKAIDSILSICGFVIIFNVICEVLSLYAYNNKYLSIFIPVLSEVTVGCLKTVELLGKNPYFIVIILSFLPICTLCQVYYFTLDLYIIKALIYSRLLHIPLSLIIYSLISNIFPVSHITSIFENAVIKSYSYNAELSFTLFLITTVFLKIFNSNKLFTNS